MKAITYNLIALIIRIRLFPKVGGNKVCLYV